MSRWVRAKALNKTLNYRSSSAQFNTIHCGAGLHKAAGRAHKSSSILDIVLFRGYCYRILCVCACFPLYARPRLVYCVARTKVHTSKPSKVKSEIEACNNNWRLTFNTSPAASFMYIAWRFGGEFRCNAHCQELLRVIKTYRSVFIRH